MRQHITVGFFLFAALWSSTAAAQSRGSLATDPAAWVFGGYSAIAMVEPEALPKLRLTAELWGMDFPDALVALSAENRDEGWQRRFTHAFAVYVDYHFGGEGSRWHVGGAFDLLRSRLTREDEEGLLYSAEFLARGGYRWFPFDDGLFIDPWLAAGWIFPVGPLPVVAGERFVEFPIQVVGTAHFGWRF